MDLVVLFNRYLTTEKRYSTHTSEAYLRDVNQYREFLNIKCSISDIKFSNATTIRKWMANLNNSGIEPRSIRRKLSSLNTFFKFLIKRNLTSGNPMARIISPKVKKRLPIIVKESEMLDLESEGIHDYKSQLMDIVVHFFYELGLRRSELIELKLKNVSLDKMQLKVLGKGNKERIIPFGIELRKNIERYIKERMGIEGHHSEYFFIMNSGRKLYPKLVYLMVKEWLSTRSNSSKKSPHILRHSFATHLADHGADIYAIKELLGHASLAATQVYTHNSIEQLTKAYKQAHPRAAKKSGLEFQIK